MGGKELNCPVLAHLKSMASSIMSLTVMVKKVTLLAVIRVFMFTLAIPRSGWASKIVVVSIIPSGTSGSSSMKKVSFTPVILLARKTFLLVRIGSWHHGLLLKRILLRKNWVTAVPILSLSFQDQRGDYIEIR